MSPRVAPWAVVAATLFGAVWFATTMTVGGDRSALLIGETTDAHHQLEMACETCHAAPAFSSTAKAEKALNRACRKCHGKELKAAEDSHPRKKFRNPRMAAYWEKLDGRLCTSCHIEHRPEIARASAVTVAMDFCVACHSEGEQDVRSDREGQNVSAHALHAGAHLNVTDATRVMATLNVARGGLNGRIWGGGAGAVMVDGKLKARETMGGFAGVSHRWSDSVRSGAYFGWVENDTGDGVSAADMAGTNKAVQSLHANVIWSPVPRANIGFEVMHGWREVYTAGPSEPDSGEATRAQIGVQYGF